jgi:hypothetical protein
VRGCYAFSLFANEKKFAERSWNTPHHSICINAMENGGLHLAYDNSIFANGNLMANHKLDA